MRFRRKIISYFMCISLVISSITCNWSVNEVYAKDYGLGNPRVSNGVSTWNCIWFGNYWQNDTNGDGVADKNDKKEPIKWRVLSINGNDAFILADKGLDYVKYNETYTSVTWESCTLRTWLNEAFYDNAFSSSEKEAITKTTVVNKDNPEYGTTGGNNTSDNIYLLSLEEAIDVSYGFVDSYYKQDDRNICFPTDFTKNKLEYDYGWCFWWLRSPGVDNCHAAAVDCEVDADLGHDVDGADGDETIRPVLHISLSSDTWCYAGAVSSDGTVNVVEPHFSSVRDVCGISCKDSITFDVGKYKTLHSNLYAETYEELHNLTSNAVWTSSNTDIVSIVNPKLSFLEYGEPIKYGTGKKKYSVWWAMGIIVLKGNSVGSATISCKLVDGTSVSCDVIVEPEDKENPDFGGGGRISITENNSGSAGSGSNVSKFFPDSWTVKSTVFPVEISKETEKDGSYKLKASIGIFRSDILDSNTEWLKYKKVCEEVAENQELFTKMQNLKDGYSIYSNVGKLLYKPTVIHASKWESSKPKLAVLGYVENEYDKYGNLIKENGKIAGNLDIEGGMSWQFATPIGPMFLKFDISGKVTLEGGPSYDVETDKWALDGSVVLEPEVALTGGYGIDKIASISAKGKASLKVKNDIKRMTGGKIEVNSKGVFTAKASVNLYCFLVVDYERVLKKVDLTLWDTSKKNKLKKYSEKNTINDLGLKSLDDYDKNIEDEYVIETVEKPIDTSFLNKNSKWNGKIVENDMSILQEAVLPSTIPLMAEIGGKQVMVWQTYNQSRSRYNSSMLMYSVFENNKWSEPKPINDDGFADCYAQLKVINGKLYIAWQKVKANIMDDDENVFKDMMNNSEIYTAEFDYDNNTFININQVTNNAIGDMMPRFVENTDDVLISYVRSDMTSLEQTEYYNNFYVNTMSGDDEREIHSPVGQVNEYIPYVDDNSGEIVVIYESISNCMSMIIKSDDITSNIFDGLIQLSDINQASTIDYNDGHILITKNGSIYDYNISQNIICEHGFGDVLCEDNVMFCSNKNKSGYLWSTYDEDEGISKIYASMQTEDGFSNPIVISESNEIIRTMSPILNSYGEWNIAINSERIEDGLHNLCYLSKKPTVDSHIVSGIINESEMLGDKTAINYVYTNDSDSDIDEIMLVIKAEDGSVVNKKIKVNVKPGETISDTVYVDLSNIKCGQKVDMLMCDTSEDIENQHMISDYIETSDISIVSKAEEFEDKISITVDAENIGNNKANVDFLLYPNSESSDIIDKITEVGIDKNGKKSIMFSMDKNQIVYNDKDTANYIVEARVDGGDTDLSNNFSYLVFYKNEKIKVDTSEDNNENKIVNNEVKKGNLISDKKYNYRVIKEGSKDKSIIGEVEVSGLKKKSLSTIKIANQVTIGGITYNVTSVAKNAFKNNKKIKKVIIGKNVKKIGVCAFANCKKIETVTVNSIVPISIRKKVFYGDVKLKKVIINSLKIRSIGNKAFYRKKGKKITFKVPKVKKKSYKKLLKRAKTNKYKLK